MAISTIIKSTPEDNKIPHRDNIFAIHARDPILQALDPHLPIYAGGYVMALMVAPRDPDDPTKLQSGYYNDVDVYSVNDKHRQQLISVIRRSEWRKTRRHFIASQHETDHAHSFEVHYPGGITRIQFIKSQRLFSLRDTPSQVIGDFDFVNCAFAMCPVTRNIYFHKNAIDLHIRKVLETQHMPLAYALGRTPDVPKLVNQLLRFDKYCNRWGYVLSPRSLNKIRAVYNKHPTLTISMDDGYQIGSGLSTANLQMNEPSAVWAILAKNIVAAPAWSDDMDRHGIITKWAQIENALPTSDWELF